MHAPMLWGFKKKENRSCLEKRMSIKGREAPPPANQPRQETKALKIGFYVGVAYAAILPFTTF